MNTEIETVSYYLLMSNSLKYTNGVDGIGSSAACFSLRSCIVIQKEGCDNTACVRGTWGAIHKIQAEAMPVQRHRCY